MGRRMTSLPKGGETIYEVIRVAEWMRERYVITASGFSNLIFLQLLPVRAHREYFNAMKRIVAGNAALLGRQEFIGDPPLNRHMAYGAWVDNDLFYALCRRMEIVADHPAWSNLGARDQIRLVSELVFESMLWSGVQRVAVWSGQKIPAESPFCFIDKWKAQHTFAVHLIPMVQRYGPEPSSEDG